MICRTAFKISAAAAIALVSSAAFAASEPPLMISYPTDGSLSCEALLAEAGRMEEIMGVSADAQARAEGSGAAAGLATGAAINGALYSGVLGRAPGLGMFANSMGNSAKKRAEQEAKRQEERIRTAETRRTLVMGLYQGRNCNAPPATPPAATTAAVAPPAQ